MEKKEKILEKKAETEIKTGRINPKKILPWIILFLILGGLVTWYVLSNRISQTQRQDYDSKIKEAKTNFNLKEYTTAINNYYKATDIIPQRLDAYAGIVEILLLKNRPDDAISIVRETTRSLTSNDKSYLYQSVGDYFMHSQDYDRAKQMYQEGLGLGVENINAELALGRALLKLGRIEDAKKQFSHRGYSDENAVEANLLLSYVLGVSDIEKAKAQIGKVSPTGEWVAFYDEYDKVLNSLDEDAKFNATKLSRVYINSGYPYLALAVLEPISNDVSSYLEGVYYMGRAYLNAKEYSKAIQAFDKALTIGGMEEQVYWGRARAYYGQNDLQAATENYSRALGYAGKNVSEEFLTEYIQILLKNNQALKAAEEVRNVLINLEKPFVYLLGVKSNYQLSQSAKVDFYIEQLDKLELADTEEKELLSWKARTAIDSGNLELAKTSLSSLENIDKYYPKYYLLLGIVKSKEQDSDGARDSFEKSIEYDLNNETTEEATKLLSNL